MHSFRALPLPQPPTRESFPEDCHGIRAPGLNSVARRCSSCAWLPSLPCSRPEGKEHRGTDSVSVSSTLYESALIPYPRERPGESTNYERRFAGTHNLLLSRPLSLPTSVLLGLLKLCLSLALPRRLIKERFVLALHPRVIAQVLWYSGRVGFEPACF